MLIKICGINSVENARAIAALNISHLGMIFYEKSPRKVTFDQLPMVESKRVGVFVNEELSVIEETINTHQLDVVQLHGQETMEEVLIIQALGVEVWKAIPISNANDFAICERYSAPLDAFLFDTKGKHAGGNGTSFNWELLDAYTSELPFIVSGGIQASHAPSLKSLRKKHSNMIGVDLNSGFESIPGVKNVDQVAQFVNEIRENE